MLKFLKNKKGNASAVPIFLILATTFVVTVYGFYMDMDMEIIKIQKDRYRYAVDMAVKTALSTIELSDEQSLENIMMGYSVNKKLMIDKDKFTQVFYSTIFRNVYAYGNPQRSEYFKRYIPMKAIIMYDTIWISSFEDDVKNNPLPTDTDAVIHMPDGNDDWNEYKIFYYDEDLKFRDRPDDPNEKPKTYYFTLKDQYFTLYDPNYKDPITNKPDPFAEGNRDYAPLGQLGKPDKAFRDHILAQNVRESLQNFANLHKLNQQGYMLNIGEFQDSELLNAVNDVTFFCLVEGIPLKSFLSNNPDKSFYMVSFGGASLSRADEH